MSHCWVAPQAHLERVFPRDPITSNEHGLTRLRTLSVLPGEGSASHTPSYGDSSAMARPAAATHSAGGSTLRIIRIKDVLK